MKSLVLVAALFGSAAVFAQPCSKAEKGKSITVWETDNINDRTVSVKKTCNGYTYADLSNYVYSPKKKAICKDGDVQTAWVTDNQNDRTIQVTQTCKGGTFADLSNYVYNPSSKCKNGDYDFGTEYINGSKYHVTKKCVGGKYKLVSKSNATND